LRALELSKSLEKGYRIQETYEVRNYEQSDQYHHETKSGGLFTSYVNRALKKKQKASGLPSNVSSAEEIDAYIADYYIHEGIYLDKSKIEKNPRRRQVAKLMANILCAHDNMLAIC
jgi:hypothetical protein